MNLSSFLNLLPALVFAPLMAGIIGRVKAVFAGRRGPPLLQPYHDLWRLLRKGAVYSTATTWIFRVGPMVLLSTVVMALALVPFGKSPAVWQFPCDFIMLAYLLALGRFFMVSAALDTGSSFEGMGASREVFFAMLAEPALLLGFVALSQSTGLPSLGEIYAAIDAGTWAGYAPALVLLAVAFFIILLAENSRIPVDDPGTHLELTMIHEVMVLDHSGPDLAFIQYGAALKLWLFALLIVDLFVTPAAGPAWNTLATLAGVAGVAVLVGAVESVIARLQLLRVPQLLMAAAVLALLAKILLR